MKLLAFILSLSTEDKEAIKDWFTFIMPVLTVLSNFLSPIIGFVVGVLTMFVLLERYKYYRRKNKTI